MVILSTCELIISKLCCDNNKGLKNKKNTWKLRLYHILIVNNFSVNIPVIYNLHEAIKLHDVWTDFPINFK